MNCLVLYIDLIGVICSQDADLCEDIDRKDYNPRGCMLILVTNSYQALFH